MKIYLEPTMILVIILASSLSACTRSVVDLTIVTPQPTHTAIPKSILLATPYAQEPAAGICASFEEEVVTVTLSSDIPDPRCSKVRADQKLTIINQSQNTVEASIGRFAVSIEPGAKSMIETRFGDYLAPGVHQLQVSPCCGAEIWLEGK